MYSSRLDGYQNVDYYLMFETIDDEVTEVCYFAYSNDFDTYFELPYVKIALPGTVRGMRQADIAFEQILNEWQCEQTTMIPEKFEPVWQKFKALEYCCAKI